MKRVYGLLILSLLWGGTAFSQTITIQNRSFEENLPKVCNTGNVWWCADGDDRERLPADGGAFGKTPEPWTVCSQTPDLLPLNASGVAISTPAQHGDWYLGLVCDLNNAGVSESIGQPLSAPFTAGAPYTFSVWLAHSATGYATWSLTQPGKMQIWASMSSCGATELLWESPTIDHPDWREYPIDFRPTQAWTHIYFTMPSCPTGKNNILIDNISGIEPGGLQVTSPAVSATLACAHTITGKTDQAADAVSIYGSFKNSPVSATVNGNNTWTVDVEYDKSFAGNDNLTVIADYSASLVPNDTIIVPVNIASTTSQFNYTSSFVTFPVSFQDNSITYSETSVTYLWDFGDGQTSTQQSPDHLYALPGNYTVSETISYGNFGSCTDILSQEITVPEKPGELRITDPAPGTSTIPNCVHTVRGWSNYRADSLLITGNIVGRSVAVYDSDTTWSVEIFFPGSASGTESITATAYFPANNDSKTAALEVQSSATADFSMSAPTAYSPVQFTDASTSLTGAIASHFWDFGDRQSDTIQNPLHTYSTVGKHEVVLTVTSASDGCRDAMRKTWEIPPLLPKDSGHLFEDSDGDGTLDRITVRFGEDLSEEMLEFLILEFSWPDTSGMIQDFSSMAGDLTISADDPSVLVWQLSDRLALQSMTTALEAYFGTASLVQNTLENGESTELRQELSIGDGMPPLLRSAEIRMSSKPDLRPDTLILSFTESIDFQNLPTDRLFEFFLNSTGQSAVLSYTSTSANPRIGWLRNGEQLVILFEADTEGDQRPFPQDSVRMILGDGFITDMAGNSPPENQPWVPIRGQLKANMELNIYAEVSRDDSPDGDAFGLPQLFDQTADLQSASAGQLGAFFTLVLPQADSAGNLPAPEDISWDYSVEIFSNLGAYVAALEGTLKCTDAIFNTAGSKNCLDSPLRKFFLPWEYRADSGRLVGSGAYIQRSILNGKSFPSKVVGVLRKR